METNRESIQLEQGDERLKYTLLYGNTCLVRLYSAETISFKIYIIVWKHENMIDKYRECLPFKIYIIVWKRSKHGFNPEEINLV